MNGAINTTYFLIDGGSNPEEREALANFVESFKPRRVQLKYIRIDENLGYSGANNVGINLALDEGVTHVCLLNPDVIVTDFWLERMIKEAAPFISTVSNAVGNEQTIPVTYQAERNLTAVGPVRRFDENYVSSFNEALVSTEYIGFFCALIRREVVEAIGLLDEQFYPGGFEDLDYCVRARDAGIELWIARHIYLHHWGSASFSKLPMVNRITHVNTNREKFESKHNFRWIDWKYTIFRSAIQDAARKRELGAGKLKRFQAELLQRHIEVCDALTREMMDEAVQVLSHFKAKEGELERSFALVDEANDRNSELHSLIGRLSRDIDIPLRLRSVVSPQTITHASNLPGDFLKDGGLPEAQKVYSDLFYATGKHLILKQRPHFWAMPLLVPAIRMLATLGAPPVVIFANGADPIYGDEKDGYVQRVMAIDKLFAERPRLYIRMQPDHSDAYRVTPHPSGIVIFDICSSDAVYEALLSAITDVAGIIYIHSILPLGDARIRAAVTSSQAPTVIDMHGVVPEEFDLYGDRINCLLYGNYEKEILRIASKVICVSTEMKRHYEEKYDCDPQKFMVCPIFAAQSVGDEPLRTSTDVHVRPRIVYAGGTQKWQKISVMATATAQLRERADYVYLTPNPDVLRTELIKAGVPEREVVDRVYSAKHSDVLSEYRNCQYGIILRDDITVNRVACPTKLIEYLACGIVPILDSANIGDFAALGMRYLSLEVVIRDGFPSESARRQMVGHNMGVIQALNRMSYEGLSSLQDFINERV